MHVPTLPKSLVSNLASAFYYTCYAGVSVVLAILLVGFVPQIEGTEIRRFVNKDVAKLRPEDYPKPILAHGTWSIRSLATKNVLSYDYDSEAQAKIVNPNQWVKFSPHNISLNTTLGYKSFKPSAISLGLVLALEANMLGHDGMGLVSTKLSQQGEILNQQGLPIRWAQATNKLSQKHGRIIQKATFDLLCDLGRASIDTFPLQLQSHGGGELGYVPKVSGSIAERAQLYKAIVLEVSQKFNVRPSLVMAIIQTESAFKPHVVSPARAMGLMQLLPGTARSMHKYVYGKSANLGFEQITSPEMNITLGVAFIKLMMTQYFHQIQDVQSREYCTIASYNMGPGRLFPFFGRTKSDAIANINAMKPEEVFSRLVTGLPYRETRAYLHQVSARDKHYSGM